MADQDNPDRIKIVSDVSDPPSLTAADIARIQQESQRLHDAFKATIESMVNLTADDLRIRVK